MRNAALVAVSLAAACASSPAPGPAASFDGLVDAYFAARWAILADDHPAEDDLIPAAQRTLDEIRQLIVDKGIITIPSEVRPRVAETPIYARGASFASMDTPGPIRGQGHRGLLLHHARSLRRRNRQDRQTRRSSGRHLSRLVLRTLYPIDRERGETPAYASARQPGSTHPLLPLVPPELEGVSRGSGELA